MPAGKTYTPLARTTLTTSTGTVTFSNIQQTYTDLILIGSLQGSRALYGADLYTRLNSDTGSNYSYTYMTGNGSAASSNRYSSQTAMNFAGSIGGGGSNEYNVSVLHFMNYANTTTYKTVLARNNHATQQTQAFVGLWRNTAAITTITFTGNGYNFEAGSTFTLYGILAA